LIDFIFYFFKSWTCWS